jgi:hypothetical protein
MKTSAFSTVLLCGSTLLFGAAMGCDGDDAETLEDQDVTASIDDAFAKTVLKGGCSIKVKRTGNTVKTTGKGGACPMTVSGILAELDKDAANKLHFFFVSEQGDGAPGTAPSDDTPFRVVIAVETKFGPADQLFVSTLGQGGSVSDGFVEVIAFNKKKGVYAYYDLEGGRWTQQGDGTQVGTDPSGAAGKVRCFNCHTTGAPLMKELHDGWGNWMSTWDGMSGWSSIKGDELFTRIIQSREVADGLEPLVIAGTKAYTKTRVDKAVKEKNLKPLARQLMCDVGEPTIIGPHSKSSKRLGDVSTFSSMLPTSIIINNLFQTPRTGTGSQKGLDNILNMNLPALSSVRIDSAAYAAAVKKFNQRIGGQVGDTLFALMSPEKSHADLEMVQELFRRGLLDKDLVADALMTDFTVSTFSEARCALADTLPDNWATADELRTAWAKNLEGSSVRGAAGLKARLEAKDDFAAHEKVVNDFLTACNARGSADANLWAEDVVKIVSQRRVEFAETYEPVVESQWLLPTDNLNSQPHAIRLNGTTCVIENQSQPFVGE